MDAFLVLLVVVRVAAVLLGLGLAVGLVEVIRWLVRSWVIRRRIEAMERKGFYELWRERRP